MFANDLQGLHRFHPLKYLLVAWSRIHDNQYNEMSVKKYSPASIGALLNRSFKAVSSSSEWKAFFVVFEVASFKK